MMLRFYTYQLMTVTAYITP